MKMKIKDIIIIFIILILPILCYITKLISFPKKDLKYKYLNDIEFSEKKHFIKSNSTFNIDNYSKIRVNSEMQGNDIKFFLFYLKKIQKKKYTLI